MEDKKKSKDVPLEYYVWMSLALGAGNKEVSVFTAEFDNPLDFYNNREQFVKQNNMLSTAGKNKILDASLDKAHEICVQCDKLGFRILHYLHEDYPYRLRNIFDFPVVLYCVGAHPEVHRKFSVTMVGTRKASAYAALAARYIARDLALAGAVVTSGLAVGIDALCHTGAVEARGVTAAFVACGLDIDYPRENKKLRQMIEKNGIVYSEHPPGERPESWHFPIRNRLMSGYSDAVMLVEGRDKSGSMHTIRHGIEQGRDIFALPGDIFNVNSQGAFNLIKDGAVPVMSAMNILEEYSVKYGESIDFSRVHDNFFGGKYTPVHRRSRGDTENVNADKSVKNNNVPNSLRKTSNIHSKIQDNIKSNAHRENDLRDELSDELYNIYTRLKSPTHIDELVNVTGIPMEKMGVILTQLELEDYIISLPGKIYKWSDL